MNHSKSSPHLFDLYATSPQKVTEAGFRIAATAENFPALNGLSVALLALKPKGFREPHWHPNAAELSYCLQGKALMTIFSPGAGHDTFLIEAGDLAYVPMGYMHHIENVGETEVKLLIGFDHESPEDLNLSNSVQVMPNHILGATCQLDAAFFATLKKDAKSTFIVSESKPAVPTVADATNRYKMRLETTAPPISNAGGWVKMSNGFYFPTLQNIAMYSLSLAKNGAREPHWHPNAGELNCLIKGTARITLLSPDGSVDTFDMKPGAISFMPRGYIHHIENTGTEEVRFAIFFSNKFPSDLGLSGVLGAYSNNLLAALFNVPVDFLDKLPKHQTDLLIVGGG